MARHKPALTTHKTQQAHKGELMRRAGYASVAVAIILIAIKMVAYILTDSISLLSTLLDSMLDVGASILNLLAIRHALMPADPEHRFGHGKAEALAGLGQAAFITGSAIFLFIEASHRLVDPQVVHAPDIGLIVMAVSIVLTVALVIYQRSVIRRTKSVAVSADSAHYVSDVLVNGGVIVALLIAWRTGWVYADPLVGVIIACYIVFTAWTILRGSYDMLMDRELPDDEREQIKSIVLADKAIRSLHDLRTRMSGPHRFVQFHIELDPHMSLVQAHDISDRVEAKILHAFPDAEVIIHQDPAGIETIQGLAGADRVAS